MKVIFGENSARYLMRVMKTWVRAQSARGVVTVTTEITKIAIPDNVFSVGTTNMKVYHNGLLLEPTIHYTISGSTIELVGYQCKEGDIFSFVV